MRPPLVSIIIPCYNSANWIIECIKSCLNQTYREVEIIVVNDGSSDESEKTVRGILSNKIKLINQPHSGGAIARNRGFASAQGEYIQFLDADDFISINKIESQIEAIGDTRTKLAVCPTKCFYDAQQTKDGRRFWTGRELKSGLPQEFLLDVWGGTNKQLIFIQTNVWFASRSLFEKAGPWDESLKSFQDVEYFARLALASTFVEVVPHVFSYHRECSGENGRVSKKRDLGALQSRIEAIKKIELIFKGENIHSGAKYCALSKLYFSVAFSSFEHNRDIFEKSYEEFSRCASASNAFLSQLGIIAIIGSLLGKDVSMKVHRFLFKLKILSRFF